MHYFAAKPLRFVLRLLLGPGGGFLLVKNLVVVVFPLVRSLQWHVSQTHPCHILAHLVNACGCNVFQCTPMRLESPLKLRSGAEIIRPHAVDSLHCVFKILLVFFKP